MTDDANDFGRNVNEIEIDMAADGIVVAEEQFREFFVDDDDGEEPSLSEAWRKRPRFTGIFMTSR